MRTLIFVMLFALGFPMLAKADGMLQTRIVVYPNCGDACKYYKYAPNTGIKPPVPNMVCFYFKQESQTNVEFTLYSSYDPQTKRGEVLRKLKRNFGTTGQFCVGSQFVEQAVAVELCNDFPDRPGDHSIRGVPSLQQGLQSGTVEMCLLGRVCPRYVAGN